MSVLLKTDPNLGNRKIILPAIGEQEIKNGILEISQEEWAKLSKIDCGIKFSNVKEGEEEPKQKENELVEDEGEDIQKKSEESEILDEASVEPEQVEESEPETEQVKEEQSEEQDDVESNNTPEATEEPVKEEKEQTDLSILSREELMELALETAKKAGEKLTQIRVLNKQALIEYLNEKL